MRCVDLGEAAVDADKSKAVVPASGRGKKRPSKLPKSNPKAAWGKLLSQCSLVGFYLICLSLSLSLVVFMVIEIFLPCRPTAVLRN